MCSLVLSYCVNHTILVNRQMKEFHGSLWFINFMVVLFNMPLDFYFRSIA